MRSALATRGAPVFVCSVILGACHGAHSSVQTSDTASAAPPAPGAKMAVGTDPGHLSQGVPLKPSGHDELAAFAAGCFWGVEDAFRHVPGVVATAVGYSGGHTENPTYEQVCTHTTGHAETVLVEYDPAKISYDKLLSAFWKIHDPTQGNRQGPDFGDSYRSVIFTFGDAQAKMASASMQKEQPNWQRSITTQIVPMAAFYKAEGYHQQYSERTGDHSCPIRASLEAM